MTIQLRAAAPSDAEACGGIMFKAFEAIAREHGFTPDFPSAEAAAGLAANLIGNPAVFGVVAEQAGRIVGSNFMSETDAIRGVGPITVDPAVQGRGVGRRLMQEVIERAGAKSGVRLLQDAFNMRSYGLYASLGFEVREPVLVMTGRPAGKPAPGGRVRVLTLTDLDSCAELSRRVLGVSRRQDLVDALGNLSPLVAERDGSITGYMTAPTFWIANHGIGETDEDLRNLILSAAESSDSVSFLLPTRQSALLRWCLDQGLRAVKPMTLMSLGEYRRPSGAYMPSVFY
ncbi:MAG: GNAT family N-acetyltransferase [Kiloniellaceae bacterium]